MPNVQHDAKELRRYLPLLTAPYPSLAGAASCIELRVLNSPRGTISGYYTDLDQLANACEQWSGESPAVYTTLNPVKPDLLARANNHWEKWARHTTADADIVQRVWLPIDCDPVRSAGISATDAEHQAALDRIQAIKAKLSAFGFAEPIVAASGNGGHLLYRIDLPNTPEVTATIKAFLAVLAEQFTDSAVNVDDGVFNAARIWKVYGTLSRKGDEVGERRHRLAKMIEVPDMLAIVPLDLIERFIGDKPKASKPALHLGDDEGTENSQSWLEGFIGKHGIEIDAEKTDARGRSIWRLAACPFCGESDKSAVITIESDGTLGYKCHHNRCSGKHWADFRRHYDPDHVGVGVDADAAVHAIVSPLLGDAGKPALPTIICGDRQTSAIVDDAKAAIRLANNPPTLFVRGGRITRLRLDADSGEPCFEPLGDGGMIDVLSRVAKWAKRTKSGIVDCQIPEHVLRIFKGQPTCGLPAIDSIIETPCYAASGDLLSLAGYHQKLRLWFQPPAGFNLPAIPDKPSVDQINAAKRLLLDELLGDFPFENEASKANALAMLLLPFVRLMIDGATPLHAIDAPKEGTGKTLLLTLAAAIWTGRDLATLTECSRDEEWQKTLMGKLQTGPAYICIDNVKKPIDSPTLAAALTSRSFEGRLLGGNTMAKLPVNCVWLATGNNIHASGEMARRFIRIRLDSLTEYPHLRNGFRHSDILAWTKANRATLVAALLTLARAWIVAGKPRGNYTMGSYAAWATTIGGILDVAGVADFLANQADLYREVNTTGAEWRQFVEVWATTYVGNPVDAGSLYRLVAEKGLLPHCDFASALNSQIKFGRTLAKQVGTTYGNWHIERADADSHANVNRYRLTPIKSQATEVQPAMPSPVACDKISHDERCRRASRMVARDGRCIEPLPGNRYQGQWRGGVTPDIDNPFVDPPDWTQQFESVAKAKAWLRTPHSTFVS